MAAVWGYRAQELQVTLPYSSLPPVKVLMVTGTGTFSHISHSVSLLAFSEHPKSKPITCVD
jgi:hypothetical protein